MATFRKTARQARPRGLGYPMGLGQDRKPVSDPLSSFYGASTSAGVPQFPFPLRNAQPSGWLSVTLPGGVVGMFGNHKFCRDGVWELRIDAGLGYRVYYA